ncbi:MAG: D-tyrosyl-tRNA(Tyr) deacylase [Gammaproteobacteria bacterium]|nr:D-tyrosyl-tRNA(Tyr) deacylase [Gammaproteobacteria bacterium]
MRVLVQRVNQASVEVNGENIAAIQHGLLLLVGIAPGDGLEEVRWLADKVLGLRIFADHAKPMNRNVLEVDGEILVVSQFTLTADTSKGRRPSFTTAAPPEVAAVVFQQFVEELDKTTTVQTGQFGADMQISLVNDGPVTFMLER